MRYSGGHLGVSAEVVDVEPCLDKGILEQVVGIFMREYHASDLPVQLFAVFLHNLLECLALAEGLAEGL